MSAAPCEPATLVPTETIATAASRAPDDPAADAALFRRAEAAQATGRTADAIALYHQILDRAPEHVAAWRGLAAAQETAGAAVDAAASRRHADETEAAHIADVASALMFAGREAAADTLLDTALAVDDGSPQAHWLKGQLAAQRGDRDAALAHYRACRARADVTAPADFMIAAMGGAATPDRAPGPYVRAYFDWYAEGYDRHLVETLGFAVPTLLRQAIDACGVAADAVAIDLGCGTGLTGAVLAPLVGRLTGVDLSPAMLEKARARGCYDALVEAVLHDFLAETPAASADLVVAGDVLVYVGDLAPLLQGVARALRPGGLFAATTERGDGVELAPSGRYRHGVTAVEAAAAAAGLTVARHTAATLRRERGAAVSGDVWALRG